MVVTLDVLPACALKVHVYWQQWDRHCTMSPRLYRDQYNSGLQWKGPSAGHWKRQPSLIKMFERSKWYIWMGVELTFWKLNRSEQEIGQWSLMLRSCTLTSVTTSGLFVYIWLIRVADVCVILVGDFTSWVKLSSVTVESQKECGFSKSILKYSSTRISAWGLTVWMLSIICTKLSNHS